MQSASLCPNLDSVLRPAHIELTVVYTFILAKLRTSGSQGLHHLVWTFDVSDFHEAAMAGVTAIHNGHITPMNAAEPERAHVYVFNNIFFSNAVDSGEVRRNCSAGDHITRTSAFGVRPQTIDNPLYVFARSLALIWQMALTLCICHRAVATFLLFSYACT